MRKMRKKREMLVCTAAAVLICIAAAGGTVCASGGQRRNAIKSRGIIDYDNGKVVIDPADLGILADETDRLEITYKTGIRETLTKIGVYVQQDGNVSHDNKTDVDAQRISFGSLVKGILQSQSVAYLANVQASDTGGSIYYKFEKNNLLEVTGDDTGMPVFVVPATEDNLTLQTAAWVNGQCLTGNGSDSHYFYLKGFIEGYAARVGAAVEYQYDDTGKIESAKLIYP